MKVIYSECNHQLWLDVAAILEERFGWEPCYWIGSAQFENDVRARFGEVCFHSSMDAVKSIPSPEFQPKHLVVLDKPLLDELAICESTALKMMDRMEALGSFSYQERIRHYHRLVSFWLSVIETYQPERVLFSTIPHMVYDYVFYHLCKMFEIPTLMFEESIALGLSFLRDSIDGSTQIGTLYQQLLQKHRYEQEFLLSDPLERYLNSLSGDYDDVPLYIRFVSKSEIYAQNTTEAFFRKLLDFKNYSGYLAKQLGILQQKIRPPINYLKQSTKLPEKSRMSNLEYRWFHWKARRRVKKLARHYHQRTTKEIDIDKPYLYVALSYQPEATTSPKGDVFVHMELMVAMLSKLVPQGWMLYVKEHPSQFDTSWAFRAHSARREYFYDDLAALKNVALVPTSFSSYNLIDQSIAVATVTGTVGWQAVIRGKPVLVFGSPWYQGCEGVFQVNNQQMCLEALEQLQEGYSVDRRKVRLYAHALEEVSLNLAFEDKMQTAQLADVADAGSIADAIATYF